MNTFSEAECRDESQYGSVSQNSPFALSLSMGLMHEALRQTQGERCLGELDCDVFPIFTLNQQ